MIDRGWGAHSGPQPRRSILVEHALDRRRDRRCASAPASPARAPSVGVRLSATTKPRSRRTVRGSTRPLPARLDSTTSTPRRRACSSASPSAGVVTPGGSDAETIARAPAATKASMAAPSAPAYDVVISTRGRSIAAAHVELRGGSVPPGRLAVDGDPTVGIRVAEHPEVGAAEGLQPERGSLGHLARGLDLVVEQDEHAEPARRRRSRHPHRVQRDSSPRRS